MGLISATIFSLQPTSQLFFLPFYDIKDWRSVESRNLLQSTNADPKIFDNILTFAPML
jgi:hypothetical protein